MSTPPSSNSPPSPRPEPRWRHVASVTPALPYSSVSVHEAATTNRRERAFFNAAPSPDSVLGPAVGPAGSRAAAKSLFYNSRGGTRTLDPGIMSAADPLGVVGVGRFASSTGVHGTRPVAGSHGPALGPADAAPRDALAERLAWLVLLVGVALWAMGCAAGVVALTHGAVG